MHPEQGEIFVEERVTVDYYQNLLRQIFLHFVDKSIDKEQVSIAATIIKDILINNEMGEPGKIINYVCRKYGIPVYFIPYCGIVRRESDVTPHLTDYISVDGKVDKDYLVKKISAKET